MLCYRLFQPAFGTVEKQQQRLGVIAQRRADGDQGGQIES